MESSYAIEPTDNDHDRREMARQWHGQNALFVVVLILLAVSLGHLARENRVQWDVSQNGRNSLSQASLDVLKKLNGPLAIAVYATPHDVQLGNIRKIIGEFLSLYQRAKPDLTVTFIDPGRATASCAGSWHTGKRGNGHSL